MCCRLRCVSVGAYSSFASRCGRGVCRATVLSLRLLGFRKTLPLTSKLYVNPYECFTICTLHTFTFSIGSYCILCNCCRNNKGFCIMYTKGLNEPEGLSIIASLTSIRFKYIYFTFCMMMYRFSKTNAGAIFPHPLRQAC